MKNLIITSSILFPSKLYDYELGMIFQNKFSYNELFDKLNLQNKQYSDIRINIGTLVEGLDGQKFEFQKVIA